MLRGQRIKKRILVGLMVGTVLSVVGYGTAIAANVAHMPAGDPENPNASPSPTPGYTLTVHVGGEGDVTSKPSGIDCGNKRHCISAFSSLKVTLTADPAPNHVFLGWTGGCRGHATCVVTMSHSHAVAAHFAIVSEKLSVTRGGLGTVSSGGAGVSCPGHCARGFIHGKIIHLVAHPHHGWHLASWSGACSGKSACTVHMNGPHHVVARFAGTLSH